ncbi:hypothetical protein [Peterkaempfera bronchialis]|nr:hypothetical protein [Peterkaempfera bronchialis]
MDLHRMWADAHQLYAVPTSAYAPDTDRSLSEQRAAWCSRLSDEAPNGQLLKTNVLFDMLRTAEKIHLLHVTHAFEHITHDGALRPSGGCLVGSIYCAPLIPEAGGLRMHNLASYILTKEVPATLSRSGATDRVPTPLVLEVTMPPHAYRELAGLDYLRLGSIHLHNYHGLKSLLSREERHQLHETVVGRTKNSAVFLSLAASIAHRGRSSEDEFSRILDAAIQNLPILGYIYFEALAEYLMLHSRSPETCRLAEQGELNNWLYKELLFSAFPGTPGRFDLSRFRPRLDDLEGLLAGLDPTLDGRHARTFLIERISYLTAAHLFTPGQTPDDWHRTRWDFKSASRQFGPLLGHLIHRELRTFRRYPDFYHYFDESKALQAWNYWNHMDIVIPFNGTIPKGEVGINPAYADAEYRVWRAEADNHGRVHPVEEIELKIAPRLIDTKHTLMRSTPPSKAASDR